MSPRQDIKKHPSSGFSLVEIMVGIVISLLSTLIVLQVFKDFEAQKRTTTSGSDTQTNGAIAIYTIERDMRMAGYGFGVPDALSCKIKRSFDGETIDDLPLVPVTITDGGNGLPDTIRILSSSKGGWSIPARITGEHQVTSATFDLNSNLGIEDGTQRADYKGDLLVAYEYGKGCTLLQATTKPSGSSTKIQHQGGNNSHWNPTGNDAKELYPDPSYGTQATLFNLGALIDRTYYLPKDGNLTLKEYDSSKNHFDEQPLIPDIVQLQAQYGFDKRGGVQTDARVDTWSDTMIDADGNGTTGDKGDIGRIYAVRLVVVARSGLKEKAGKAGCVTTTSANKPTWSGGAIDITANTEWQCYRYKTFETVIPLRNLIWGKS